MTYNENIERMRKKMLMNQREFAGLLKITNQAISNYERGCNPPSLPIVKRLVELARKNNLNYTVEDFLY